MRQKKKRRTTCTSKKSIWKWTNIQSGNPSALSGAYHQLYEKEEALPRSTFVLRVCVSLILFLIFAGIDYEKTSVGTYDSAKIIEAITYQQPVGEFLK